MEYQIGKYLIDEGVVTHPPSNTDVEDGNIFYNGRPDASETITAIYSETVPQPDYAQGFANDFVGVKFLTRGRDRMGARSLAWEIHKKLAQLGNVEITAEGETVTIVSVDIVNPPTFLEVDNKNRTVFVSHYSVHGETQGNKFRKDTITTT